MKKYITFAVGVVMVFACICHGEYLVYVQETGKIVRHDSTITVQTDGDGHIIGETATGTLLVGSTTNDMNATQYTNVSQLVLVPLEPIDLKADLNQVSPEVLKAVVAGIVKAFNAKLPAQYRVTAAEVRQAIKESLP